MRYWVFNEGMLDDVLAEREARRQQEGATEQQARDETVFIKTFLFEAGRLQGLAWDAKKAPQR